ncbi:hypothetical protein KKF32_01025 [Patescibacteria group bacterium]|nr:hypothetical protein [Patescibacteria group bacterium]
MKLLPFKKIDKNNYPKCTRSWSFTSLFATLVFLIGNKLWTWLIIFLFGNLLSWAIYSFGLEGLIYNILYAVGMAITLFVIIYSTVYGRIVAWENLKYNNNENDINEFKKRQKIISYFGIFYYFILILINVFIAINQISNNL